MRTVPLELYGKEYKGRSQPDDINRVTNDTLGFSKIFVVGLPERTDKRDALSLTAALTGFHVDFVDGVRGESIPDKAVTFGIDRHALMETNLGSWRGHMNAIRRIVEEDLESARIMEADMEWDVRLRSQLEEVAKGSRELLGHGSDPHSGAAVGKENAEGDRGLNAKCISVTPPVFFHHKARGRVSGDSDIQEGGGDDVREKGTTENIVWSARNNIRNMIMGTEMESQF